MVKRTITITTILLILSIAISLIIVLNKSSFAADGDIASGTSGTCSWVIDSEGILTISPIDGVSGEIESVYTNKYVGPWAIRQDRSEKIKKVVINEGVYASEICDNLFGDLVNCVEMDLVNLDTSETTSMRAMFSGCRKLQELDLSDFDTSNVTYMYSMFKDCSSLTNLNIENFNTSKVTDMSSMFSGCRKLQELDVTHFDTSNVTYMSSMFKDCSSLANLNIENFNTGKVTNMASMFSGCSKLQEIDVTHFDTSKVENLQGIFNNCKKLNKIKLGDKFNPFDMPKTDGAEEYFTRDDDEYGPYTYSEFMENYNPATMNGTWLRKTKYLVSYSYNIKPNGAKELPEDQHYWPGEEVKLFEPEELPEFIFDGWYVNGLENEYYDSSETFIMPENNVYIEGGYGYYLTIEHYTENINNDEYELFSEDKPIIDTYRDTETGSVRADNSWYYSTEQECIEEFGYYLEGQEVSKIERDYDNRKIKIYYKRNKYNVTYSYEGEIPPTASGVPDKQTYKYGESIVLPEEPTAEGYVFSGWNNNYKTMPAFDIEVKGSFIKEDTSTEYKIEYYFDGKKGDSLTEIKNAAINQEVSIDPQKSFDYDNTHYTLVSTNHKINVSEKIEENIICVYYEKDVLDYEDRKNTTGDGIADKYQVIIVFKVENGTWDDGTSEDKKQIITLYDKYGNLAENGTGELKIPEVGNKPNKGYQEGNWNTKISSEVNNKDNAKEYIYTYSKIGTISEIKGDLSNPKTDDLMQNYLLVGIGGLLVLALVSKIRRKYSRKAKKIQY